MVFAEQYTDYKRLYGSEDRLRRRLQLQIKWPDMVFVIAEPSASTFSVLQKRGTTSRVQFAMNADYTAGQLLDSLRQRVPVKSTESLLLYDGQRRILSAGTRLATCVKDKEDGFVYVTYSMESTFG